MKKVSDYDEDGFSSVLNLVEGTVTKFFPQEDRQYGFVRTNDGTDVFFHMNKGINMGPFGVKTLEWIPRFEPGLSYENRVRPPKQGDRLVLLTRKSQKGLTARDWSTLAEYEKALEDCTVFKKLEEERIRTDPRYRGYPNQKYKKLWVHEYFEDITKAFHLAFPYNESDPVFERFERETLTGWEPCADPRI